MMFDNWVKQNGMLNTIGMGGADADDTPFTKRCQRIFSYLLIFVGIGILYQWHEQTTEAITHKQTYIISCLVWLFFLIEFLVMLKLSTRSEVYVRHNWMKVVILVLGLPYVFDFSAMVHILDECKPLLALVIMLPSLETLKQFLADGYLGTTLIATFVIIVVVGVLAAGVDPNIKSPIDGVWWALATISTVGYGDVVPTSWMGRMIGMVLILFGLGLFVIITANFLALFLKHQVTEATSVPQAIGKLIKEIHALRVEQQRNSKRIRELSERVSELLPEEDE